ncbi:MAG: hypothetical protein LBT25_00900 [Candidatus Symbiothrix sp.]|jgi:hypothetical protein|nr:hypothetical protein [Candidatus Symbiothrix sp.]
MTLLQPNKRDLERRIKVFFHSKRWKNVLGFSVFVVLAFAFWTLQYFRQKFEFEVPVSVQYTEVPAGISLPVGIPRQITLNVQDKGTVWLQYLLNKNKLSITIALKTLQNKESSYLIDNATLSKLISDELPSSSQLKSFSPDRIEIHYLPLIKKVLPVTIDGVLSPSPGYMFSDSITIEPSQITVYGSKETVDTLFTVRTEKLDKRHIEKKISISAQLIPPLGVKLSTQQVKLTADIEEYTEKIFVLPVFCRNLPENRIVRFFPSSVEVYVQVGLSKYNQISESDFEISIDYNSLILNNATNFPLSLSKKPVGIVNYRIVPEMIEFLVEQKRQL